MNSVRAVLFDLDQTLVNRTKSVEEFLVYQWNSRKYLQLIPLQNYIQAFITLDNNGTVWKDIIYKEIIGNFNLQDADFSELLEEYLNGFKNHIHLFDDVEITLRRLQESNLKLGIITNGRTDLQSSVIEAAKLDKFMNVILISESENIKKPDPEIFQRALDRLNLNAVQCAFVGDSTESDILGAHNAGMRTVWFENKHFLPPDQSLNSIVMKEFKELPSIINSFKPAR